MQFLSLFLYDNKLIDFEPVIFRSFGSIGCMDEVLICKSTGQKHET